MPTSMTVAPFLIHRATHEFGLADGGDENVRAPARAFEIARLGVGDRHRAAFIQEKLHHRTADEDRAPDDQRVEPRELAQRLLEQNETALRRAGHERGLSLREQPRIERMKAVHILHGVDGEHHAIGLDLLGQRQLHENAVDLLVGVELRDQLEQRILRGRARQAVLDGVHARLLGLARLVAHVNLARRVIAHEHDRKPGLQAMGRLKLRGGFGHALAQIRRAQFSVDNRHAHVSSSNHDLRRAISASGFPAM